MSNLVMGGCACGGIRYEISAPAVTGGLCHCRDCQQESGAGHAAHLGFPRNAVKLTGEPRLYRRTAESGRSVEKGFCAECGSPVFVNLEAMPDLFFAAAGSLDDPSIFKPGFALYTRSAQPWDQPPAGLPAFPAMPTR